MLFRSEREREREEKHVLCKEDHCLSGSVPPEGSQNPEERSSKYLVPVLHAKVQWLYHGHALYTVPLLYKKR